MTDGKREELKERLWALDERLGDFRKWKEVIEFSGIDIPEAFIEELDDMEKEALSIVNENGGSVEGLRDEFAPWTVKGRDIVLCRKGRIVGPDALKRLFDFLGGEWMVILSSAFVRSLIRRARWRSCSAMTGSCGESSAPG